MEFILQYPQHRGKAVTFSYDDGQRFDRRLVALFNRYGLRATFHLNSGIVGREGFVAAEELSALYEGHEVACHGRDHAAPTQLPQEGLVQEFWEDRQALEAATGRIIRGCSYAYGLYDQRVMDTLRSLGFSYSRTVQSTGGFDLPEDFLAWHPTCHHNAAFSGELLDQFLERPIHRQVSTLYLWGHSYEFDRDGTWEAMEALCAKLAGRADLWYATNQEIVDYVNAARRLVLSADGTRAWNPTCTRIYALVDGVEREF